MRLLFCLATMLLAFLLISKSAQALDGIVDKSSPLETIETDFGLADGPAWDGSGLFIPDVKGEKLFRFVPSKKERLLINGKAGRISATFFNSGKLFLSNNAEGQIDVRSGKKTKLFARFDPEAKPSIRPNDLVVDKHGGVYVTLTRQKEVVYISPDGNISTAVAAIETPNGIILSPDESTLYVSAYVPKKIFAYMVVTPGKVIGAREFAFMNDGPDKGADGMTIDRAGNVYCAGPSSVWVWDPTGEKIAEIKTPTRPINCTFGDADMRSLYITGFGGLYRQRMLAYGRPPQPFVHPSQSSKRPPVNVPKNVTAHLDTIYARTGNRKLLADIFVPQTGPSKKPTVMVVHGGGWLKGDKSSFRALAVELASRGFVTAAIEYRLGYEAKFPAGIRDCNEAVRFLRTSAATYSIDPNRIAAVGGSAGGHLVGLMAAAPHWMHLQSTGGEAALPVQSSRLNAAIVMAGPMQITSGNVARKSREEPEKSNANKWLGKTIDEAPKKYRLADAHQQFTKDCPPILFMSGEKDNPERNQPSREKLKSLGVWTDIKIYKDGKHGCWNQLPWFNDMVNDMETFLREHMK